MSAPAPDRSDDSLEIERLRRELLQARAQIKKLTRTVADQAKTLAAVTDDCPPWAPSLAIVYWLYAPTRRHEPQWNRIAARLRPVLSDIGDVAAPKITPMIWDAHRARRRLEASPATGQPVSESMLNRELERAKEMLDWAVENKLIKFNALKPARRVPVISRRETWLPTAQIERLLDACNFVVDDRLRNRRDDGVRRRALRAFVLCCHDSMLRLNEAMRLRRDQIRPDGRVELSARTTKSRRRRSIFLTPRTLKAIAELPQPAGCPAVFNDGTIPIHPRRMGYWFRKVCELAGVDAVAAPGDRQVQPRDLRASGASTADENGARATSIRDALGHSFLATTEIYLRSGQADNARAVSSIIITATGSRRGPHKSPRTKKKGG